MLVGWKYRKRITISGSTGAGTNYQVLLKVGESSGASGCDFHLDGLSAKLPSGQNDSGDLRFTSSDGTTLLDFWVEKVEGSSPNRVAYCWVKVNDSLDSNQDIWIYYGNSSASNVSSVSDTFIREINGAQPVKGSWHFDEGSGTTAYDSSGNNNGTINGATWVDGKFGKALSFDGVDDYVDYGDKTDFEFASGQSFSIEFWMKAPGQGDVSNVGLITKGYAGAREDAKPWYLFRFGSTGAPGDGKVDFFLRNETPTDKVAVSTSVLDDNNWHYIVGVYNSETAEIKLYVDGVNEATTGSVPEAAYGTNNGKLIIGEHNGNYLKGFIDEVHIYNKALTADEISDLYNNYGYTTKSYPGKVLVRKRVDPEPAFSSAGATESVGNAIFMGVNF